MTKKEQITHPQQAVYRSKRVPFKLRAYRLIRRLLIGYIVISIANMLFLQLFYTPKAYNIASQREMLLEEHRLLHNKIMAAQSRLEEIAHRDNIVYRSLFGLDTIHFAHYAEPYPLNLYSDYDGGEQTALMVDSWVNLDIMARALYAQSLSFDELQLLAKDKEELSSAIPAIWPIDRTLLKHGIGGYGMRLHPIYRRYIMHKGIDMACPTGSPVYATGDAVVTKSEQGYRRSGYGQMLLLKHKFGYETRYAHLSERLVNVGDTVRRGDVIGLVGNTGGSTGPHLHYEVILGGRTVDPINFFNRNMSKEEYQQLMDQVQEANLERIDE